MVTNLNIIPQKSRRAIELLFNLTGENLNVDDKIITRAVFKLNKHTYVMDGINIEPFEFTEMVSELLSKLTNK